MRTYFQAGVLLCLLLSSAKLHAQQTTMFGGGQPPPPQSQPQPGSPHRWGFHRPTPEEREAARRRIGITLQQQSQIEELFMDSEKQRRAVQEEMHGLYDQRNALFDAYDLDRNRERDLRKQIGHLQEKLLQIHAHTEEKLRAILNRDQFDRLRAVLKEHHHDEHHEFDSHPRHGENEPTPEPKT